MGCGSSGMRVEPSTSNESSPEKNGKGRTTAQNGSNNLRGDRISMMDARQRREEENKEHRKKLSTQQSNKVANSRNSSRASLKRGSLSATPDQKPLSIHEENTNKKPTQNGNINNKANGDVIRTNSSEIEELHSSDADDEPMKILPYSKKKSQKRNNNKQLGDVTKQSNTQSNQADYIVHEVNKRNSNNEQRLKEDPQTDSKTNARIIFVESPNPRQSIDSIELKDNANHLVSNILGNAVLQIQKEEPKETSGSIPEFKRQETYSVSDSVNKIGVEFQAKNIVDDAIKKALFKVNNKTT